LVLTGLAWALIIGAGLIALGGGLKSIPFLNLSLPGIKEASAEVIQDEKEPIKDIVFNLPQITKPQKPKRINLNVVNGKIQGLDFDLYRNRDLRNDLR